MTPDPITEISPDNAAAFVVRALVAAGARPPYAQRIADSLVAASQHGRENQGLARLPAYVRQYRAGGITSEDWALRGTTGPVEHYDGMSGSGHVHLHDAADRAAELTHAYGVGIVGVSNSTHCGTLNIAAFGLAEGGLVGLLATNAPATVAPRGAAGPVLGTNPIAFAAPVPGADPVVCDLATSQASRGAILSALAAGELVPTEWAVDPDGRPTSNPEEALQGFLLPLGGTKGFALAIGVEILTGVLLGPNVGPDIGPLEADGSGRPQGIAHLAIAIAPDAFGSLDSYGRRAARLREVIEAAALPDVVRVPGGRTAGLRRERTHSIPVSPGVAQALDRLADELEIAPLSANARD